MFDKLRVGIIGSNFGVIGLLPAFYSLRDCIVVAVCAQESEHLLRQNKYSLVNYYTDWHTLLEREELDAIALAVTPGAQYEIAKVAINRGLDVFAEKPLAANLSQALKLYTLAGKKGITHGIDFIFPEISEWKRVKELLDDKVFGDLKHLSVSWDWLSGDIKYGRSSWKTSITEGGGVLSFYFSHGLYYLEFFAGRIVDTRSLFTHSTRSLNGGEVGVDILLKFENGVTGDAHVSCFSAGMVQHRLIFQCEKGVIVLENNNAVVDKFSIRLLDEHGDRILKIVKDRGIENEDERVKIVRKLAARFISASLRNEQMTPSFKEGLRVQELIEKIRRESSN